ncbi:D-alanyl-D-alanine carboxypeptidase [Thiotrichales bacterium 19S9-12]|nr:D-alanyl-D-alanine carboxypeptidase [Thiotrichales bacterium 19S9-11]MCF6812263.1 D-alanyl-D-alanine carboxypeptidase [Thiotrichales bacterium 19S9-12]
MFHQKLSYLITTVLCIGIASSIYAKNEQSQGIVEVNSKPTIHNTLNTSSYSPQQKIPTIIPEPPNIQLNAAAWVLMDFQTGAILSQKNMNKEHKPASLTKILTAYIIAQALKDDIIKWDENVPISKKAWKRQGSKLFIKPSDKITVETLYKGMAIASGNDATIALAEFVAGSDKSFVHLMNQVAKQLGMNNSHFETPDGMPAEGQYSSAYDMAVLARAFIHNFPELYKIYSTKSFTYNGITQQNRNRLLNANSGVDGIKTGYTDQAGFNLASSALRDDRRLIAIVLGTPSSTVRTEESQKILTYGFRFFENYEIASHNKPITTLEIDNASTYKYKLPVTVKNDIVLTLAKGQDKQVHLKITANENLKAPIKENQEVGTLTISLKDKVLLKTPVYALQSVEKAGFFTNISNTIRSWF